jgi:hypothetical protein
MKKKPAYKMVDGLSVNTILSFVPEYMRAGLKSKLETESNQVYKLVSEGIFNILNTVSKLMNLNSSTYKCIIPYYDYLSKI